MTPEDRLAAMFSPLCDLESGLHTLKCGVQVMYRLIEGSGEEESNILNFVAIGMSDEIRKIQKVQERLFEFQSDKSRQARDLAFAEHQAQLAELRLGEAREKAGVIAGPLKTVS
jgi:hypothetical protein